MMFSPELLTPIAGDNPAGADLRYDPVYDKIKEARREDLDVPAGEWETTRKTADWPLVIKLATEALTKRTKDLQIAVWLSEGLLRRDGFGGFRQGLELIHALLTEYWDNVYPELDDDGDSGMRAAPLAWLGLKLDIAVKMAPITASGIDYLDYVASQSLPTEAEAEEDYEGTKKAAREAAIAEGKATPEDFESAFAATPKEWYRQLVADIQGCLGVIDELDASGDELFGDEAPSYRTVRDALEEVSRPVATLFARKLELEPDPEPVAEDGGVAAVSEDVPVSDAGGPSAAVVSGAPAAGRSGGISPKPSSVDDAASRIAAAARYLREQMPTNPAPYLLVRGYRWGELRVGGGTIDPKLLAAPPTESRVRLKTLSLDGQWSELLDSVENVMSEPYGRGWLDLQRHALTACDRLGGEFENVASAIRGSLRSLLADLPELPYATLMDDSPTANAETLRWLEGEGLLGAGEGGDGATTVARPRLAARERDPRDRALEHVRAGNPGKAIEYLMLEASQAKSARSRFLRRTEATAIMVENGLDAVALPILRELAQQIERFQLEEWESGEMVAEPLGLLYRCLAEEPSTREDLYLRICRLDPMHAMTLKPNGETPVTESPPEAVAE